jgi:hypothetical protein
MGFASPKTGHNKALICADLLIGKDRQVTLSDFCHGPPENGFL